ncbi:hypothetical protein BD414DRAFT_311098 [Trametes punicea]|nr:hypothetical protein BD414DRAFT_311098 [Trametes punicea]
MKFALMAISRPPPSANLYVLATNTTAVEAFALTAPGHAKLTSKVDVSSPACAAGVAIRECHALRI